MPLKCSLTACLTMSSSAAITNAVFFINKNKRKDSRVCMVCFGKQRSKLSTNTMIFLLNSVKSSSSSVFSAAISLGAERVSSLSKSFAPS